MNAIPVSDLPGEMVNGIEIVPWYAVWDADWRDEMAKLEDVFLPPKKDDRTQQEKLHSKHDVATRGADKVVKK